MQRWHVILEESDRKKIKMVLRSKKVSIETKKRAQILQDLDEAGGRKPLTVADVADKRGTSENTVVKTRRNFAEKGFDAAVFRKKRLIPPVAPKVTGDVEAHIIATACSKPPQGATHWTMQMIADKIVLNGIIESISDETVRLILKKTNSART